MEIYFHVYYYRRKTLFLIGQLFQAAQNFQGWHGWKWWLEIRAMVPSWQCRRDNFCVVLKREYRPSVSHFEIAQDLAKIMINNKNTKKKIPGSIKAFVRNISILDRALKGDHRKIRHYDILKKRNGEERKGLKDCFYAEVDNKETRWQDSNSEWNNINRTDCSGRTQTGFTAK